MYMYMHIYIYMYPDFYVNIVIDVYPHIQTYIHVLTLQVVVFIRFNVHSMHYVSIFSFTGLTVCVCAHV